jgi:predicted O-methyltransferase YrrM
LQETSGRGILQAMSRTLLPEAVERYVTQEIAHESDVQRRLRAETAGMPHAGMQIGADQGALLALLARLVGARLAIEIGTFTGYSALAIASALPAGGKLICCDVSEEWTSVARRYWQQASVAERIELRLAPATDTLAALLKQGGAETFDFAFMDAAKSAYVPYYAA